MQGERRLPRVIDRRYGLMALEWVQSPDGANGLGDATGARPFLTQRSTVTSGPLAKVGVVLPRTPCVRAYVEDDNMINGSLHAKHTKPK